MKKNIIFVFTAIFCLTSAIAFAEQNDNTYGLGTSNDVSTYAVQPTDFVFDIDNYVKIQTRTGSISVERTKDYYCLNMIPVRQYGVSVNDKGAAGTLFVTSDAHLQNAWYYTYDALGLAEWNRVSQQNLTTDTRKKILSDNVSFPLSDYRIEFPDNNEGYYIGMRKEDQTAYNRLYHDGIHFGNLVATKPRNMSYFHPDPASPTGYKNQNYEVITYHVNLPYTNNNSHVLARQSLDQSVGGEVVYMTPRLLGCYKVQPNSDGINYGGPNSFFKHVEFLWLVQHNYKTAYPAMQVRTGGLTLEQRSLFDDNARYVTDEWITTIAP